MVPEHPQGRRRRLKRESARRRSEAFSNHGAINNARKTAITLAWRLAYEGKSLPIHIDLQLFSGEYSRTERFSVLDAAFTSHVYREMHSVWAARGMARVRSIRCTCSVENVNHRNDRPP
jgi:hypothetical protein